MFDAGCDIILVRVRISLQAAYLGCRKDRCQVRIFTGAFRAPAPSGIPCDVQHRCKMPVHARIAGLPGRHGRSLFKQFLIKGTGFRQRDGIYRIKTMYNVQSDQERDPAPALLQRDLLQSVDNRGVCDHHRADPARADIIFLIILMGILHHLGNLFFGQPSVMHHLDHFGKRDIKAAHDRDRRQVHLPDLFFQCHFPDQFFYSVFLFLCQLHICSFPVFIIAKCPF